MVVRVGERIYRKIFPSVAAKHTYEWLESIPRPARHCLSSRKILQDCMVTIPAGHLDAVSQLTEYFEALKNEIKKDGFNLSIGVRYVVLDAHKSFSELLRNGNDEQIEEVVSEVSLDGDIDGIYQAASMGLQTAEADRRAAREVEA